jgi:hypothetical protein
MGFVDRLFDDYLSREPHRDMYLNEPEFHSSVTAMKTTLAFVERAMQQEDVPPETIRRVLTTAVWGQPEGPDARMRAVLDAPIPDAVQKTVDLIGEQSPPSKGNSL